MIWYYFWKGYLVIHATIEENKIRSPEYCDKREHSPYRKWKIPIHVR